MRRLSDLLLNKASILFMKIRAGMTYLRKYNSLPSKDWKAFLVR